MRLFFCSLRLLQFGLLLAMAACQRGGYPVQPGGGYAAEPGAAAPHPANEAAPTTVALVPTTPAARTAHPTRQLRQRLLDHYPHAYPHAAGKAAHARPAPTATYVARRPQHSFRRAPTMSEDTKAGLLFFISSALLVAGGLALAIGVGGWLAIAGGAVLVVLGLALALLWLYALAFGRNMGH